MSYYDGEGLFNPAYHDSETLEIDRSPSRKSNHHNHYDWNPEPAAMLPLHVGGGDWLRGQGSWRSPDSIPMVPLSSQYGDRAWQLNHEPGNGQIRMNLPMDSSTFRHEEQPPGTLRMSVTSMRRRGTLKTGLLPGGNVALEKIGLTEEDVRDEIMSEEQDLVKELVALSTRECIQAIRDLPMCMEDKKNIRNQVLASKSSKKGFLLTCSADCSEQISLSLRRCGVGLSSARQAVQLWQGTMKEIGGRFGTSVLSYFSFLKWLLMFNTISFLVNFGFITIPQLVQTSGRSPDVRFTGLELITGAGYFNQTVMYYGGYINGTKDNDFEYNMQLAYFFTIAAYLVLCGVSLIYSMAKSFRRNFVLSDLSSGSAWRLLCSWDFSMVNERAVRQRKNNLRVQLKESLSEVMQTDFLAVSEKMKQFGIHLCTWVVSAGLAASSCAAIYYLCQYNLQQIKVSQNPGNLKEEASTLLLPFVVSLFNLVIPLLYSLLSKVENYSNPRFQIYVIILRNVFLKMSILGILCYHWVNNVTTNIPMCWESYVGQDLYRLVIVDFFFSIFGSFFGEFLRRIVGTRCMPSIGIPEFDIAKNVLDLIYAQTLTWIGIYFSPLLPLIQMIKLFLLFYLKKVSLNRNCQPPRRSGRAAQMQTIYIALLFFPSFVGALSLVAYTVWCLTPSDSCGPFQGLNTTFEAVSLWMEDTAIISQFSWAVWIYSHMIKSELFFFLLALILLVLIYFFWQITQGRKMLIILLKEQIINEGKDKAFLLEKLRTFQNISLVPHHAENVHEPQYFERTYQTASDYTEGYQRGACPEEDTPPFASSALIQAMLARQQAEEEDDEY
ncbi:transmembrane channel-like protein 5 isoform X1 [Brienomyrus brachyistius]|uniref:transmembrane channel-like protein 5 isoform X1 n=2 Tax=Brienomyrus brachyistius TaxID=42636 RepID=UPI0020B26D55|nr:transmembrane channel-like protein 5 isoform X1 [Brienomyrus brachyistius]